MTPDTPNEPAAQSHEPAVIRNAVNRRPRQLPWPRSVRLPEDLDDVVGRYMEKNRINFNQLCTFALQQFVTEPQQWDLHPVESPAPSPLPSATALANSIRIPVSPSRGVAAD
jgi:hypothetical protein